MKSIRQLFRQPFKTIVGILLVTVATAVLCISFSQKMAAADTADQLRQIYMTVALPTGLNVPNRQQWIQTLMDSRPDLIKGSTGLVRDVVHDIGDRGKHGVDRVFPLGKNTDRPGIPASEGVAVGPHLGLIHLVRTARTGKLGALSGNQIFKT